MNMQYVFTCNYACAMRRKLFIDKWIYEINIKNIILAQAYKFIKPESNIADWNCISLKGMCIEFVGVTVQTRLRLLWQEGIIETMKEDAVNIFFTLCEYFWNEKTVIYPALPFWCCRRNWNFGASYETSLLVPESSTKFNFFFLHLISQSYFSDVLCEVLNAMSDRMAKFVETKQGFCCDSWFPLSHRSNWLLPCAPSRHWACVFVMLKAS